MLRELDSPRSAGSRGYDSQGGDWSVGLLDPSAKAARNKAAAQLKQRRRQETQRGMLQCLSGRIRQETEPETKSIQQVMKRWGRSPVSPDFSPGCLFFSYVFNMNAGIPATVLPRAEARLPPLKAMKWTPRGIWLISSFTSAVRKSSKAEIRMGKRPWENSLGHQIKWRRLIDYSCNTTPPSDTPWSLAAFDGGSVHHTDAATAVFSATHLVEQVVACAPSASYKLALQWTDQVLPSALVRPPRVQKDLATGGPTRGIYKTQLYQKEYYNITMSIWAI